MQFREDIVHIFFYTTIQENKIKLYTMYTMRFSMYTDLLTKSKKLHQKTIYTKYP